MILSSNQIITSSENILVWSAVTSLQIGFLSATSSNLFFQIGNHMHFSVKLFFSNSINLPRIIEVINRFMNWTVHEDIGNIVDSYKYLNKTHILILFQYVLKVYSLPLFFHWLGQIINIKLYTLDDEENINYKL